MRKLLELLNGLNLEYLEESDEIQVFDSASWAEARKRLGKAYYLTSRTAVYEIHGTRFTLVAPAGVDIHA